MIYQPIPEKRCYKCKQWLPITEFSSNRSKKDGLRDECKPCHRADSKRRKKERPDLRRAADRRYAQKHSDLIHANQKRSREKHKDKIAKARKIYYADHKEYYARKNKEWIEHNRERSRARKKAWNKSNPDKIKQYSEKQKQKPDRKEKLRAGRIKNAEYRRIYAEGYNRKNRQKINERNRKNRAKNPSKFRNKEKEREARKRELPWDWNNGYWNKCQEDWGYCCAYCGTQPEELTPDHIIPQSDPRPDNPGWVITNIVPACGKCNTSKLNRKLYPWLVKKFGVDRADTVMECISDYFALFT